MEAGQAFIGGLIDVYSLIDNLNAVFNSERLINGLEPKVSSAWGRYSQSKKTEENQGNYPWGLLCVQAR